MAVKIKLKRMGKIRTPQYRIIIADSRTKRDGRAIEEIGKYHPKESPSLIQVDSDRAQYWLGVGAQPTEPVLKLLKITGDWQRFKGLPGGDGTLKVKETATSKTDRFKAALAEVHGEDQAEATTAKKKSAKKSAAKKTPAKKAAAAETEAAAEETEAKATKGAPAKKATAKTAEPAESAAPEESAPAEESASADASAEPSAES